MEKVRTNITDTPHAKESLPPEKPLEQPPTPMPKKPAVRQVSWDDKWKDLISRGDIDALISQIANDRVCRNLPDHYFNDVTRLVSNLAQNDIDEVIDRIGRQNIVFASRLLLRARLILERKSLAIPSLHESFRPNTTEEVAALIAAWERASEHFINMANKYAKIRALMNKTRTPAAAKPNHKKVPDGSDDNSC